MIRVSRHSIFLLFVAFAASAVPAFAQQQGVVTGDANTGFHMKVVSRSTEAVDYRHKGSTKIDLKGTDLAPSKAMPKLKAEPGASALTPLYTTCVRQTVSVSPI